MPIAPHPAPDGPGSDDRALVDSARAGDRAALETLLRRHHDRVNSLCRRLTGNDADALDATQEALIAVVRGLPRFDGRAAFSTWVYRVATNASLDEVRRRSRRRSDPLPDLEGSHWEGVGGWASPGDQGGSDLGAAVADRIDIDRALARLTPEFRAAVVLRDLCGLDYAEIADVLDIPPGTVRSRIARARAALATTLAGNQTEPADRPTPQP